MSQPHQKPFIVCELNGFFFNIPGEERELQSFLSQQHWDVMTGWYGCSYRIKCNVWSSHQSMIICAVVPVPISAYC